MILKNKTMHCQNIEGQRARAFRTVIVSDDIKYDTNVWEEEKIIINKNKTKGDK